MSETDFAKYHQARSSGQPAREIYLQAVADGLDEITCFRMLREVCGLTLVEAKRVIVTASGLAPSLESYQEDLIPGLEKALST